MTHSQMVRGYKIWCVVVGVAIVAAYAWEFAEYARSGARAEVCFVSVPFLGERAMEVFVFGGFVGFVFACITWCARCLAGDLEDDRGKRRITQVIGLGVDVILAVFGGLFIAGVYYWSVLGLAGGSNALHSQDTTTVIPLLCVLALLPGYLSIPLTIFWTRDILSAVKHMWHAPRVAHR